MYVCMYTVYIVYIVGILYWYTVLPVEPCTATASCTMAGLRYASTLLLKRSEFSYESSISFTRGTCSASNRSFVMKPSES